MAKSNREVKQINDFPTNLHCNANQTKIPIKNKGLNLAERKRPEVIKKKKITVLRRPTNDVESIAMAIDAIQAKYCGGPLIPREDDNLEFHENVTPRAMNQSDVAPIKKRRSNPTNWRE
jgi:hypothetical protein